jgi:hypothetical protein
MASPDHTPARGGSRSRLSSQSPGNSRAEDLAGSLSTRMGKLLLTDKEATGLVIGGAASGAAPKPRWAVVGKVCSPRKLIIGAL